MSKTIMTVDDSASVRQMVSLTLKDAGYTVIEACDGKDALSKLSGPVDMIVTDLNMPNLDGIGLIKGVRSGSLNKFIPIIMLTTESQDALKKTSENMKTRHRNLEIALKKWSREVLGIQNTLEKTILNVPAETAGEFGLEKILSAANQARHVIAACPPLR